MAQYNDINQFIYATIQEYIDSAKLCIDALKGGSANDCYGMSALVLLTSAIDAMGTYFRNSSYNLLPNDSKDWKQELGVAKNHYENILRILKLSQIVNNLWTFYMPNIVVTLFTME